MNDDQAPASEKQTRLAEERTRLAQERTVLAHIRTGFASFLFGIGLLGLFGTTISRYAAYFFILVGAAFLVTSLLSYLRSIERASWAFHWHVTGAQSEDL